jgi:hypothetical protein
MTRFEGLAREVGNSYCCTQPIELDAPFHRKPRWLRLRHKCAWYRLRLTRGRAGIFVNLEHANTDVRTPEEMVSAIETPSSSRFDEVIRR